MDAGWAAIIGAAVGAVGGGAAPLLVSLQESKERKAEHQLRLIEEALNNVARERRLLHSSYSLWRNGLPSNDLRVEEMDKATAEAIEAVWTSENLLRIHFGEDSRLAGSYDSLIQTVGALKDTLSSSASPPTRLKPPHGAQLYGWLLRPSGISLPLSASACNGGTRRIKSRWKAARA